MIGISQIIVSTVLTYLYASNLGITYRNWGIFKLLLIFVVFNILYFIFIFILFVIHIYLTEKSDTKGKYKHFVGYHINKYIFNFWYRVHVKASGKEYLPKNNNFVIYSNHIELTDPLYIMQVFGKYPVGFVAKESLFKVPILKNLLTGMGCISISRVANRSAMNSIVKSIKQVKQGQPMGIFPEGTRTYQNDLIEYKPGAFKLAIKAKADIVPVCLYNMHKLSAKFRILPTTVYVRVLPTIKYEDYKDMETTVLAQHVYDITNEALEEFKSAHKH